MDDDEEPGPTLPAFASRPDGDALARAVSKSRIANEMFEVDERVTLGRYHLLEPIGAGGMGTVWGAFDPELDRRVAIKLLKAELASARDRMLAEGQALAKLAHPNVVTVFDVGVFERQVYVVMEWIRGKTLREHVEGRTVREIVAVYRAAGEGLAAAHDAGLVHRDFKPDNVIVGEDERVRVLDFGLARGDLQARPAAIDTVTRGAGTPRYMAPEQAAGNEITPAADQFAFCVSLRESLGDRVPAWVQQIIDRGTAPSAAARFPSMRELLAALARDPAVMWRRRLLVAGALAVAGGAFAIGTLRGGEPEVERCTGGEDEVAKVWNPTRATALHKHLAELGPYGAGAATRLLADLDKYGKDWVAAHRGACLARDRGELTPQLYEHSLACLARTSAALDTIVDVASTARPEHVAGAIGAVSTLPASEGCIAEARTSTVTPPPANIAARVTELAADIERARTRALAIAPDAVDFAKATAARAVELAYLPLVARAHLELGRAYWLRKDTTDAIEPLQRASDEGLEANDPAIAVEAYAMELRSLIGLESNDERPANLDARIAAVPIFESIATGLGPSGNSARAFLFNNIGTAHLAKGEREAARAAFTSALEARPPPIQIAQITQNLALATDDVATRTELSNQAIDALANLLGADHPSALDARVTGAMFERDPAKSLTALRLPCERFTSLHPHLARASNCWFELGTIAEELGRIDEARVAMSAVKPPGKRDLKQDLAEGYLLALDGKHAEAVAKMLAVAEQIVDKPPHVRVRAAAAWLVAAQSQLALGQRAQAISVLRRAEDTLAGIAKTMSPVTHYQRYFARVRANLARLTISTDPVNARERARQAAQWYRAAGGYEAVVTEVEALARTDSR